MVPCSALESLLNELGMDVEMGGNFAELIQHYTEQDSPIIKDFQKHHSSIVLSDDEEEVFRFYRAIVVKKAEK